MAESIFFDKRQRSSVGEALRTAEALAGNYLQVDLENFDRFPYDVLTLAHLRGVEKTPEALAQVCKYEYYGKRRANEGREFYRICLQDDRILQVVRAEFPSFLQPLLLYVITHELIHVVRFSMDPKKFHLRCAEKKVEESEVHRATYDCLKTYRDPQVDDLLERYRSWWDAGQSNWERHCMPPLTNEGIVPNF